MLLLVEDEELIAEVMKLALEDGGYSVVVEDPADGGQAAVDRLSEQLSGLITDLRLPGKADGWELARHARELRSDLPVVYMSADSAADWAAKGVPNSAILQKPFAPAQLDNAISTLLVERDQHKF